MRRFAFLLGTVLIPASLPAAAPRPELVQALKTIQSVDREGKGHAEAKAAAKVAGQAPPGELVTILEAIDAANPLAANWLAGAFETASQSAAKDFPKGEIETFLLDRTHSHRARVLAFEALSRADGTARDRLIPGMIDDPSAELRREAVARLMKAAGTAPAEEAKTLRRQAFAAAVDGDQVQELAKILTKEGETLDLVKHFGFVTRWSLIGPFDNRGTKGFDVAYPPEKERNLQAEYEGMKGAVQWAPHAAPFDPAVLDPEKVGLFDIAKLTEPHKGAATYATTEFTSEKEQPVEFRLATSNAWKLWLNGELVFAREEYHRGMFFDQYIVRGTLRPGKNELLLKVCQNEQTEDWAQDWSFQFRVCDLSGKAVLSAEPKTTAQRSQ